MRTKLGILTIAAALAIAACGDDDDVGQVLDDAQSAVSAAVSGAVDDAEEAVADARSTASDVQAQVEDAVEDLVEEAQDAQDALEEAGGAGTATLTLDNGETFEFSVLCMLEPQMAAGSEILFTAVSYDDPGLDITQFGDEGNVTGVASVSVYDGAFNTLWDSGSIYPEPIELSLDGSTITGQGTFYQGGDIAGATTTGQIVANC